MRERPQRLLQRHALIHLGIDIAAGEPVVAQLGSAVQVHGRDDAHVALAPLAAAVGDLVFEELERVQAQQGLRHFERFAEVGAGFVGDEHEVAVGFVFADFLHDAEDVDAGEEGAPGVVRYGLLWEFGQGDAEFVDFWWKSACWRRLVGGCLCVFLAAHADGWGEGVVGVGIWVVLWYVFFFFDAVPGVCAAEVEEAGDV